MSIVIFHFLFIFLYFFEFFPRFFFCSSHLSLLFPLFHIFPCSCPHLILRAPTAKSTTLYRGIRFSLSNSPFVSFFSLSFFPNYNNSNSNSNIWKNLLFFDKNILTKENACDIIKANIGILKFINSTFMEEFCLCLAYLTKHQPLFPLSLPFS